MLMIKLRKTGCHFSAAWTGSGYDDKLARRFDKFIFAVSLIADNQIHVSGIARDRIVQIGMNAALFQPAAEHVGRLLPAVLRNYDIVYQQPQSPYGIDQAQNLQIVSDAQIRPNFILFDIGGVDAEQDFADFLKFQKQFDFIVGSEAGQNARGVIIIKNFPPKFQIQLIAEQADSFSDMLCLFFDVKLVVKGRLHEKDSLLCIIKRNIAGYVIFIKKTTCLIISFPDLQSNREIRRDRLTFSEKRANLKKYILTRRGRSGSESA